MPAASVSKTPMASYVVKRVDETFASLEKDIKADYGEKFLKSFKVFVEFFVNRSSNKANVVTDALESAIALEYPDAVYKPCRNFAIRVGRYILESLPRSVVDWLMGIFLVLTGFPTPKEAENSS